MPITKRNVIGYIGGEPTVRVPQADTRERKSVGYIVGTIFGIFVLTGLVASVKRVN